MKRKSSGIEKSNIKAPRKVFIVEDHPVFREGLVQLIGNQDDLAVCGVAGDAEHALQRIRSLKPDLVLVDITLPGKNGMELIKEVRAQNRSVKLLVLSMHDEALYADRVLKAGGDGYIMKQEDPEEVVYAIRDVLSGHVYVSEEVITNLPKAPHNGGSEAKARPLRDLTDSELEILELLGQGKTNLEIAGQLRVPVRAVNAQSNHIKKKLNLKSTNALIRHAVCWVETGKA